MRTLNLALAACVLLSSSPVFAGQCKADPEVTGPCFAVHGRMYNGNFGSVARIWRIGTKRILGVTRELPASLSRFMEEENDVIYGDFLVCPLTRQVAGEMQLVCVESAQHVVHRREP